MAKYSERLDFALKAKLETIESDRLAIEALIVGDCGRLINQEREVSNTG